jgi:hypothetical protein
VSCSIKIENGDNVSDFKFAEYAIGKNNRGKTAPASSILELDCFNKNLTDTFSSIFVHTQEYVDYHDSTGGKSGYSGLVKTDFIPFDFDSEENLPSVYADVQRLILFLLNEYQVYPEQIRLYFSGNKGFHVLLLSPEMAQISEEKKHDTPALTKAIAITLAKGLKTFDTVIYDRTRLFRLPNTKHSASGLYKIPVSPNATLPEILELAKTKQKIEYLPISEFETNKYLMRLITDTIEQTKNTPINQSQWHYTGNQLIDGILNGFPQGDRNKGMFSLGRFFYSRGIGTDIIEPILKMINTNTKMGLPEKEIETIVHSCSKYAVMPDAREPSSSDILTMYDAAKKYYHSSSHLNNTDFGYKYLSSVKCFSEGEVFYIAARGGTGKTTLLMHLLKNISIKSCGYGLLFSLEMQAARIFYRAGVIEISAKDGVCDIDTAYNTLSDEKERNSICEKWKQVLIVEKDGLIIEQVEKYIVEARAIHPNISVVGIDYLGYLKDTKGGSNYEQVSRIAKEVKGLSKRQNIKIIMACQTSREGEDGFVPVKLNHMRDSGAIEESADYVLGMWKDRNDTMRLHCKILKNRNAEEGIEFDFVKKGLFYEESETINDKSITPKTR